MNHFHQSCRWPFLVLTVLWLGSIARAQETPKPPTPVAPNSVANSPAPGPKLSDAEIVARVDSGLSPVSVAIERLRGLKPVQRLANTHESFSENWMRIFAAACTKATREELRELGGLLAQFPEGDVQFDSAFVVYADAVFRLEAERLRKNPQRAPAPAPEPMPAEVRVALDPVLHESWAAWRALGLNRRASEEKLKSARDAKAPPASFRAMLPRLLPDPQPGVLAELLARDDWPWCATASPWQERRQERARLLAALGEGRMLEAAHMAFLQHGAQLGEGSHWKGPYGRAMADFLTGLGLDWETLFAGSLLLPEGRPFEGLRLADPCEDLGAAPMFTLATYGSDRGLRMMLALLRAGKASDAVRMNLLLYALVSIREAEFNGQPVPGRGAVSPQVRADLAAELAKFFTADVPPVDLQRRILDLPVFALADLKDTITALFKHPNYVIAVTALRQLVNAQLAAPNTEITPPPPPIRLHLLCNGEPMANVQTVITEGRTRRVTGSTDGEGRVSFPVDNVLEPAKLTQLIVATVPSQIQATSTGDANESVWPGPWIETTVPVRIGDDREIEVQRQHAELEVTLEGYRGLPADTRLTLMLQRVGPGTRAAASARVVSRPSGTVKFQRLELGVYRLSVSGPGVRNFKLNEIALGKLGSIRLVKLEPGRRVVLQTPAYKMDRNFTSYRYRLTSDGKDVAKGYTTLNGFSANGLPLGKYHLHIDSTKEMEAAQRALGFGISVKSEQRHQGYDLDFEISESSPQTVDLGTVTFKPEGEEGK